MSDVIRMKLQDVVGLPGGGGSDAIWRPSVNEDGDLSWTRSTSTTAPETVNIKGPAGADGAPGTNGADGEDGRGITSIAKTATSANVDTYTITYSDGTTSTYTVTNGLNGQDGADGDDGVGIASVAVNASNHLIVTKTDGTTQDAGEIQGGGGTTVVANPTLVGTEADLTGLQVGDTKYKVPSGGSGSSAAWGNITGTLANQTDLQTALDGKLDADIATISGGGANLVDFESSKYDFKPSTTTGVSTWSDGTTVNGTYTSNLWSYTPNEKIKFKIATMPSYFRFFIYDADGYYLGGNANFTIDDDGFPYVSVTDVRVASMCFVLGSTDATNFETLYVGRYDAFGEGKVVINDLYFSDENVAMAKTRLSIPTDILSGKKWAVCGDSFTAGDFTGITTPTIPSGRYAGKNAVYPYLIATRCNITVQDLSRAGRTLALPSDETSSYNSFTNFYQSVDADADYLTMYFGINDSHQSATIPLGTISDNTTASFYGAWNVILTWLITNRPNLHIGIIVSNGCDSDDYRTATIAIANKYGIPYIDMNGDSRTPCMIRSTNAAIDSSIRSQRTAAWRVSSTNAHPNADAHAYEATFIEDFLRSL